MKEVNCSSILMNNEIIIHSNAYNKLFIHLILLLKSYQILHFYNNSFSTTTSLIYALSFKF